MTIAEFLDMLRDMIASVPDWPAWTLIIPVAAFVGVVGAFAWLMDDY